MTKEDWKDLDWEWKLLIIWQVFFLGVFLVIGYTVIVYQVYLYIKK